MTPKAAGAPAPAIPHCPAEVWAIQTCARFPLAIPMRPIQTNDP